MVEVDESTNTITLTRGDTVDGITVVILDPVTGEEYTPQEGDVVRFACKEKLTDEDPLIVKVLDNASMILRLESEDTKKFRNPTVKGQKVKYSYDIELTKADGTVSTFISDAIIQVCAEVH